MLDSLDADAIRRWCAAALEALTYHQREIDGLNVYPVADGDTGTNLALTLEAAQRALRVEDRSASPGEVLRRMAQGALLGARGNSGVIMSQLFTGIADAHDSLGDGQPAAGRFLATALRRAADAGYAAVATPVEGTILTVARAAASAAEECDSDHLVTVITAACFAADAALVRTPDQLSVLARAGVVDAGGQGLCVVLHALAEVITGVAVVRSSLRIDGHTPLPSTAQPQITAEGFEFEVQYLLDSDDARVDPLRQTLATLGDSLVIVGTGDGTWNVHVHVNDIGAAIEAGIEAGRPSHIRVTRLLTKNTGNSTTHSVAVFVEGAELNNLLRAEGALTSLDGVSGQVISLGAPPRPWNGGELRVIPLRSPVQALAALAVHDPLRSFDDDVIAMAEAAGACRYAEVTVATRAALTVAGPCQPGDVVVLIDGEVNLIADDMATAAATVLDRMLSAGGELATLLLGEHSPPGLAERLQEHTAKRWPFVETRVYPGGQQHPLVVGVE